MTMIFAIIHPDRAIIGADSLLCDRRTFEVITGPDGRPLEDHKLIAQPRYMLTALGAQALRNRAQARAHEWPDADAAIHALPAILRDAFVDLGLHSEGLPVRGLGGHTVIVVGWSEQHACMVLAAFEAASNFEPVLHGSSAPGTMTFWRSPDVPRECYAMTPDDRESLVAWAHLAVAHHRSEDPSVPIGGPLRLAEITKDSITTGIAGDLGEPTLTTEPERRTMPPKSLVAAVALSLAACGGGGDAVEVLAGQLAPGAATVAQTAASASGSVTAPANVSGSVDICNLSWTNTTAAPVSVQIEGTIQAFASITGTTMIGASQVQIIATTTSSGGPYAPVILYGASTAAGSSSPKQVGAGVRQFDLAAGDTVNAKIQVSFQNTSGLGTGTTTWSDAALRVTAIKR